MNEKINITTQQIILATIALALGSFMNILDMTIVNTAVSHIAGDFAVPYTQGTWVITTYAVAEAIMLPLTGWLTQRFGMLKLFTSATLLFTFASVLCGISTSMEMLLIARILQGIVGASMIPLSQTLLMSIFPPEKRGAAIGLWAMTVVIAPIAGPILGGWLTDNANWRWAFYINVPLGLFVSLTTLFVFKKIGWKDVIAKVPVDFIGICLLVIGIGSLQLMLDKGSEHDWFNDSFIISLALISFIFMVIFVIWELHQKDPIVDLKYFKDKNFVSGVLSLSIGSTAFFATVVIMPIWLQNYLGYTAFDSGMATATTSVFVVLLAPIIGANMHKFDSRKLVAFGFIAFFLASYFGSNLTPDITQGGIALNRLSIGIGLAFFFIPLNNILLANIPDNEIAAASGISNFMRNMGNSFGTSLVVSHFNTLQASYHEQLVATVQPGNHAYNEIIGQLGGATEANMFYLNYIIDGQAALLGINSIIFLSGLIMLSLIPVLFIAKKPDKVVEGAGH
jgi:DHA2 family multidrug resistance protein